MSRTVWNRQYNGQIIHFYTEVDIEDRPAVFGDMPQHWWWLHHNPSQMNRGISKFDLSKYLPKVDDLSTQINKNTLRANRAVLDELQKDAEPYVPYLTGHLNSNVHQDPANGIIEYTASYAAYAFEPNTPFGTPKKYTTDVHSEARGFPVEYAVQQNSNKYMNLWVKEALSDG